MKPVNFIGASGVTKCLSPVYIRVGEPILEYVTTTIREGGGCGRYMAVRAVTDCPGEYLVLFDRDYGYEAAKRLAPDGITVHDDDPSIHMDEVEAKEFLDSPTTYLSARGEALLGGLKVKLAGNEEKEEEEEEDEEDEEEYDEDNPKPIKCTSCGREVEAEDIEVRVYVTGYVPAELDHHVDSDGDHCFGVGDVEFDEAEAQERVLVCPRCGAMGDEDQFDGVYSLG